MRQSAVALAVVAATASSSYYSALAFQAFHAKQRHGVVASSSVVSSSSTSTTTTSALAAFRLKDGETQNMFEGPLPLVKERDACGVGFIANVNSGGEELLLRWCAHHVKNILLCNCNCIIIDKYSSSTHTIHLSLSSSSTRRIWHAQSPPARPTRPRLHGAPWRLWRRWHLGRRCGHHDTNPLETLCTIS